ncbi:MAG: fatty acid desaturase family protein [Devosiaceae bacterium]
MAMAEATYEKRDYALTGPEREQAIARGLVSARWYHSDVPRAQMKALMARSDAPAIRDTVIWIGFMLATGIGGILTWGTWAAVPCFLVYGVLYGSACDSRWHECGHNSAFKTPWMNKWVYIIASFMVMRNPVSWRWSHMRHHIDTLIVGRDPEISFMRPTSMIRKAFSFIGLPDIFQHFAVLLRNAFGKFTPDELDYIPEQQVAKATFWARIFVGVHLAAVLLALVTWSILPLMIIGGPRIYGTWHMVMTGLLQHGGLAEDVLDHRLNSRTVHMNPVSRWIYWNMNYHVEHHMFPMVPYHALPKLHALIKDDLPPATPSIVEGYREMIDALKQQRVEPNYSIRKQLPPTAKPYREDLHDEESVPALKLA